MAEDRSQQIAARTQKRSRKEGTQIEATPRSGGVVKPVVRKLTGG